MVMVLLSRMLGLTANAMGLGVPQAHQRRAWGDGIVDQPYFIMMYDDWDDILLEELAVYSPALARSAFDGSQPPLSRFIDQLLTASLWLAVRAIGKQAVQSEKAGLDALCVDLPGLTAGDIMLGREGRDAAADVFGEDSFETEIAKPLNRHIDRLRSICQIRAVARQRIAEGRAATSSHGNPGQAGVDLYLALSQSVHSGINAAYVHQHLDFAQELFLTGICLGQLADGRDVMMTPGMAGCLLDHIDRHKVDPVSSLLHDLAERGAGAGFARRKAKEIMRRTTPCVIRARTRLQPSRGIN